MASYRDFLPAVASGDWVRPSDWLPMPVVTEAEQKFVGLHGVWEDGDNVVAFLFRGAYTVDWGDGTVENIADNVKAEHQYDWASIPSNTTTSQGYRQVIITVTPNGGNLTSCNFQQRYTGRNQAYSTGFLDVTLSMPNASSGASIVFGESTVLHINLQQFTMVTIGGATSLASLFTGCQLLQSVPLFDTSAVTNMASMFQNCFSIVNVPLMNTAEVTTFTATFLYCYSIVAPPLWNTVKATTMDNMFFDCFSLTDVPLYNTANVLNMTLMFRNCQSLLTIPLLNTVKVTNMSGMFSACRSLESVPLLDMGACLNASSMFIECNSIASVPLFNTATVTNMELMFDQMRTLRSIPALSTAAITTGAGSTTNFSRLSFSLARCEMVFARDVSFWACGLGAPAIVEIFTNLVDRSATTSATITITGNWGTPLLTAGELAIATSKNWIVTT